MEPKRRGRPPKKLVDSEKEDINTVSNIEEEKNLTPEDQPRRGRGRPRKRPIDLE